MAFYSLGAMFLSNRDLAGASVATRLLVSGLALLLLFGILLIARMTWLRAATPTRWRVLVPATFVVASTVRAVAVAYLLLAVGATEDIDWAQRVPGAVIGFTAALLVSNAAIGSFTEHRARLRELQSQRDIARTAQNLVLDQLANDWSQTMHRIRAELLARVDEVSAGEPTAAARRLRETADEVVHPLSQDLAGAVQDLQLPKGGSRPASADLSAVIMSATQGKPLSPVWTAILFTASGAPFLFVHMDPARAVMLMVIGVLEALVLLSLGNAILCRVTLRLGALGRVLAIITVVVAIGFIMAAPAPAVVDAPDDIVRRIMLADITLIPQWALILVVARVAGTRRDAVEAEVRQAAEDARWQLARAHCIQWQEQRALARAMHGPVQNALAWGVIQLELAQADPADGAVVIASVREEILRSLDVVGSDTGERTSLVDALGDLAGTWRGVCEITWSVPDEVQEALMADPVASDCVRDLALEACWNAIRHAHATDVAIEALLTDPGILHLRVTDDGVPGAPGEPGLGSRMLTDMTLRFRRHRVNNTTVLDASLPVRQDP
jgi:signal transduction histidine kinase